MTDYELLAKRGYHKFLREALNGSASIVEEAKLESKEALGDKRAAWEAVHAKAAAAVEAIMSAMEKYPEVKP